MNTCTPRIRTAALAFLLAIGSVAPAMAQKAALVRDIDRPSVSPVAVQCNLSGNTCQLYVVPANMVLVVETFSFNALLLAGTTSIWPNLYGNPSPRLAFSPMPQSQGFTGGTYSFRAQYPAGSTISFQLNASPGDAYVGAVGASLFGYLVAAGTP